MVLALGCVCGCEDETGTNRVDGSCDTGLNACGSDCYDLQRDAEHCGSCSVACINGQVCMNGSCTDRDKACGDSALSYCEGRCVNFASDPDHCGDCKTVCASNETCKEGSCEFGCAQGFELCDNVCYDIAKDSQHCGDCETKCHGSMFCNSGSCSCQFGRYDCDGDASNGCESTEKCESSCSGSGQALCGGACVDLQTDYTHCGDCKTKCDASEKCEGGVCIVASVECDAETQNSCWGQCVDRNDRNHCGTCGNACGADENCENGSCRKAGPQTCEPPRTTCYGQCVDLTSDDKNCGKCLNECGESYKCVDSECTLQCGSLTNCGGACIDTQSSAAHCGDCTTACLDGQSCVGGHCQCASGMIDCDGDPSNGCETPVDECACNPGDERECWRGALDEIVFKSEFDKSICEKGKQICDETGRFWGSCSGGVYPSVLTCDIYGNLNGLDNDCDGAVDTVCKSECDLAAGDMSYIGCEYWGAYIDNLIMDANSNHTFVLSNPNDKAANVYIYDKAQAADTSAKPVKTATIEPHNVVAIEMNNTGQNMCQGSGILPNAFRIRSDTPITAYQFSPLGNPNAHSNDASLLLPANVLGKKYIGMTWRSEAGNDHRSYIAIIATEPGTTKVKFKTTSKILATETAYITTASGKQAQTSTPALAKGEEHEFSLNRFEVLTLMAPADDSQNQTGSLITADKNIAVFGGSRASYVPQTGLCCRDHIEEQLFPTQAWGKSYLAARAYTGGKAGDFWVITARDDNTTIHLTKGLKNLNNSNAAIPDTITLNAGETYSAFETRTPFEINADKPISVGQFLPSQEYNQYVNPNDPKEKIGDPSFLLTVPYEQYRSDYDFMVPTKFDTHYLTIIAPKDAVIVYDGKTLTDDNYINLASSGSTEIRKEQIGSSDFYVRYLQVYPGVHHMTADVPFGLYSYGYFNMSSYGYPIGLDLRIINTN